MLLAPGFGEVWFESWVRGARAHSRRVIMHVSVDGSASQHFRRPLPTIGLKISGIWIDPDSGLHHVVLSGRSFLPDIGLAHNSQPQSPVNKQVHTTTAVFPAQQSDKLC